MAVRKAAPTAALLDRARAVDVALRASVNADFAAIGAPAEYALTKPDEKFIADLVADPDWLAESEQKWLGGTGHVIRPATT